MLTYVYNIVVAKTQHHNFAIGVGKRFHYPFVTEINRAREQPFIALVVGARREGTWIISLVWAFSILHSFHCSLFKVQTQTVRNCSTSLYDIATTQLSSLSNFMI